MRILSVLFKFLLLFLMVSSPLAVLGFLFYEKLGLVCGIIIGYFFFAWLCMRCEDGVIKAYEAQAVVGGESNTGLSRTYFRALQEMGDLWRATPRLLVFNDPASSILVLRRLGGDGTILLSRGLLILLTEEEIRALLRTCLLRTRERGIVLSSVCAFCSVVIFKFMPKSWVQMTLSEGPGAPVENGDLKPLSAARFAMGFVLLRIVSWLGAPKLGFLSRDTRPFGLSERASALQKIATSARIWGTPETRGAFSAYLITPVPFNSLVNPFTRG